MILNNIAHKKYINGFLEYNNIIDYIMNNINDEININLNNFKNIVSYIDKINLEYNN